MPACTFPVRAAVIVAVGVVFGGCVSEADRREASRLRRPAMPTVGMEPGVAPVVKSEDAILAATLRHAEARDFAAARKVLETVADQGARERLAREVAAGLAAADPLAATAWALALSPGLVQTAALEIAARAMAKRDADNAIRWALEFSAPAAAGIVRRAVADELVVADPQATVRRLLVLPRAAARDELLGFAAAAWARHDVSGVETWLRELPDSELRQRLTASAGFEIAQTNPARAIGLAESLPPGRNRWLLLTAIAETWVAVDARAAFAWTHQLPAGEPRDAAVAGLDAGLGIAVSRRMVSVPDSHGGSSRWGAGGTVGEDAPIGDSAAFAAWRATQSAGLSRDEAILAYVRERGGLEPLVVGQWVATLPGGPARDRAMEVFWETLVGVSPAEAASWLQALPRTDRSDEMIERTAREWRRTNPDAAAAWLRELSLPPERIEWLIRR